MTDVASNRLLVDYGFFGFYLPCWRRGYTTEVRETEARNIFRENCFLDSRSYNCWHPIWLGKFWLIILKNYPSYKVNKNGSWAGKTFKMTCAKYEQCAKSHTVLVQSTAALRWASCLSVVAYEPVHAPISVSSHFSPLGYLFNWLICYIFPRGITANQYIMF